MAPPSNKRKSTSKGDERTSKIIKLKMSPEKLKKFSSTVIKEESPSKDSAKDSPSTVSNPLPPATPAAAASAPGDAPPASTTNTPVASGTPGPSSMPPPSEIIKKRGVKRSSAVALGPDGLPIPKVRGKPGPKKRPRLEDGSIDHSNSTPRATGTGTAAHKLGPKANQGAINAGLRALDRTGKPCRKWQKGSFTLKSFTGVVWEIPRWKAPPRILVEAISGGSASDGSSKENKDNSQGASEKSNGIDNAEKISASSQNIQAPSPAPSAPIPSDATTPLASVIESKEVKIESGIVPEPEPKQEKSNEVKQEAATSSVVAAAA